ncbi:MAG: AAA family ATPase [candidate division WOR-3 bacterium]|nr:MAG: AAA family ATPase [candidate division WOR-3 bacterium]
MNDNTNVKVGRRQDESIDFRDLVNVFLRRRNLFFYITVPIFLGIIIAQLVRPFTPIYKATFDIGVTKDRPVEGFFSPGMAETPTVQIGAVTQRVISSLLSVNIAEKVADTLGLYAHVKNGYSDIKVEARIKEDFAKSIGPMKLRINDGMFSIQQHDGTSRDGLLGRYVDFGRFELKVTSIKPISDGRVYEMNIYPRERMALALRNSLAIKVLEADKVEQEVGEEKVPFSGEGASKKLLTAKTIFPGMNLLGILRIDVHWSNPEDALRIAQALSEQIIIQDVSEKSQQFTQSRVFIDSQMVLYQNKLNEIEEQMRLFKEEKKISDLRASTQSLIDQVSTLESKKNQLQIEQEILRELGDYLAKSAAGTMETPNLASVLVSSDVLQKFYGQLLDAEAELKSRLKEYSSNHPKVMEIRAKLSGLKEQMQVEISKRIPSIKTEIQSVENQINDLQTRLQTVPVDEISLARLERDKETAEKLYTFFAEKLEETRVQEAGVTSDLNIVNPPMVSDTPVNSRRRFLTLFLAMVISVLAGGFAVFVVEYIDNTVKDPDILNEKTGLALFGSIPAITHETGEAESGKVSPAVHLLRRVYSTILGTSATMEGDGLRMLDQNVSSPEFEAFRKLAMNLEFAHPEKHYRAIYVTSPGPEEGKTFTALNLGIVYARTGKKVLLVDTDFRKKAGHLSDITKAKKKRGLFDVLRGEAVLEDIILSFKNSNDGMNQGDSEKSDSQSYIVSDEVGENTQFAIRNSQSNIDILPIGGVPANPFIFLESEKMKNIIGGLKLRYDFVIFDGVPVMLFADAAYLANYTDGVLITTRYGRTDMKDLMHAKDILATAKVNIIGLVVNGVPKTRGSYYYQYYHKYYDKYYKS